MCSVTALSVLLLVSTISQCSSASPKPFFRKDYTYKEETKNFYKVHTVRRVWQDAKHRCQMEGATLFHPDDAVEAQVALGMWNETEPYDWMYLGMSDLLAEGVWETVEGRPEIDVYTSWRTGEPNYAKNEDCALWRRDNTMSDYLCDDKYPFICRRSGLQTIPLCDISDPYHPKPKFFRNDYTLLEEFQAFYKVHTLRRNFQDARIRCQMEGAILFHPENDVEAEVVMGLWNRSEPYDKIYLGVTDLLAKGVWETLDGHPLLEVYHNWEEGQPDDAGGIEDCVLWSRDKTLNDYTCHEKYPFICKKSQRSLDWKTLCDVDVPDQNVQSKPFFFRRDYTYIKETQAFYKVHTARKTWLNAKKLCQMEGATLFYPDGEVEADIVQGLWNKTEPYDWIYLGMSDLVTEGVWETVDGRAGVDVHNWWRESEGEPNSATDNEDCALWRRDKTQSDYTCHDRYPFICKKSLSSLDWNLLCDMPEPNYHYNNDFGKCYKVHLNPKTWSEAYATCSAEQSYLAIINSRAEADYLAKITEEAPKDKTWGYFLSGTVCVHLGFHNRDGDGWKTIRGTSLEDSGYTGWGTLQPDGGDKETCGSMFYNGRLNDLNCTRRCFSICEHDIGLLGGAIDERWTDNTK